MKKKISAKILITQLVILCITLFIFPMKVKADDVAYPYFLYNVHHSYTEHNELIRPFLHQYDFYITANHEVTGRYIISIATSSDATSHTWSSTAGEIYISEVMGAESGCAVLVTGQKDLIVTVKYYTDSPIDILNVRSVQFSQTDLDGNIITSDQSLWSEVQKIEDHTYQILAAAGFVNQNLSDIRSQLTAISNLITTTNTTLSSLLTTATNILTKVTSIDTAVQQIDNTIDTITWLNAEFIYKGYTTDFTTFDNTPGSKASGGYVVFKRKDTAPSYKLSSLLKISFPLFDAYDRNNILFSRVSAPTTFLDYSILYTYKNRQNTLYYLTLNDISWPFANDDYYISIKLNVNTYVYSPTTYAYSNYIDDNDIEYWELMGYFNQYNFYEQQLKDNKSILEKLSELIIGNTQTNNSVNKNDQSNQQFNQQQQQYDQIESTFQSSFTTDQQAVQQTFSNNSLTIFADTALWFTQQLNALYNASGQMKILFTMPLLLGLALFFIGRGAKTAAPNTIDSFYSSEMVDKTDGVRTYHVIRRSNAHKVYHGFNRGKK